MEVAKTIRLEPGHYVVAVSGGVDSMALLDMLARRYPHKGSDVRFTIAHFDHGIREDSHQDRQLVHETARQLHLPFVFEEGRLGPEASEAAAREARYNFLRKVQKHAGARGIITAHHLEAETILVVSHGAFGRALRHHVKKDHPMSKYQPIPNAELIQLR